VSAADEALYEAKRAGRDCVRVDDPDARASAQAKPGGPGSTRRP
jgi:hypothetical protein